MNLLVVGNGFDIAHDLSTRYSDFLDFMTLYISRNYQNWQYWGSINWNDEFRWYKHYGYILRDLHSKAIQNAKITKLMEKYEEKFKLIVNENDSLKNFYENNIFRYCLYVYAYKQSFDKEFNWIDIENEIFKLLTELHSKVFDKKSFKHVFLKIPNRQYNDELTAIEFFFPTVNTALKNKNIPQEFFRKEVFHHLFNELENFSLLLKNYLRIVNEDFQENPNKIFKINNGKSLFIDNVLSFNYTDTFRIYTPKAEVHFVNGSLEDNKIILGVENLFPETDDTYIEDDIQFFFKNVQRIFYDFTYKYKNWFEVLDIDPETRREKYFKLKTNVYILGHSLTSSDKYILTDLIMNADNVTVYYFNQKDKWDKTTNLYRLLGDRLFSQHMNNPKAQPNISLVDQQNLML